MDLMQLVCYGFGLHSDQKLDKVLIWASQIHFPKGIINANGFP